MQWFPGSLRSPALRTNASEELLAGPIRGDLLGADHLAARAREIARHQKIVAGRSPLRPARLLERLAQTRDILATARNRLILSATTDVEGDAASDWLLDNYHVVQEQLQAVRSSLPGGFYRELPELTSGPLTGYPRVYEMAISLISHTEARLTPANVDLYVEAFQGVTPLSIGELWAVPAMLRLGLIESVRRMTLRTVMRLDERDRATAAADRIRDANTRGGPHVRLALQEFAEQDHELSPHFVSRFLQLLRQTEGASIALEWLEHWLHDAGVPPTQVVAESTQRLALTQRVMANSITSLRDVGLRDWRVFVEHQSVMNTLLCADPDGTYPTMVFATRDRYRHVVERIAKATGRSEEAVAAHAIELARQGTRTSVAGETPPYGHVGYYLVDQGLGDLEKWAGYRPTVRERLQRWAYRAPNVVFVGGLTACTTIAFLAVLLMRGPPAFNSIWLLLLLVGPLVDLGVVLVQQVIMAALPTQVLPRLDIRMPGVATAHHTVLVMPTLFGSARDVQRALERLEVQFLANSDAPLHFAMLSDFMDASAETMPGDAAIVAAAEEGIARLNAQYASEGPSRFFLLHRARQWNASQDTWMGWERKRGKIHAFNRLLRDGDRSGFSLIIGDVSVLRGARFAITLDADTMLPQDGAAALIGTMAHPLNRAVYDATRHCVRRGFGILQPRVGVSLPSAHASWFAAIASGQPGVDPYSTASSDVYQDLHGEGSYTGKGIYDVEIFERVTEGRFPENVLLSHDLLEGNYARAGLASDVIVYDDFPSTYLSHSRRKHRWIRGDWQLLTWLRATVPGPNGRERNRLSFLARWKIVDNLRRSTIELSQMLLLFCAWTVLPGSPVYWTLLTVALVVAPWVVALCFALLRLPQDGAWREHYASVAQDAWIGARQAFMTLVVLPHQAWISADAILRTLYRVGISRRQLLEWQSAALVEQQVVDIPRESRRAFRGAMVLTALVAVGITAVSVRTILVTNGAWSTLWPLGLSMWPLVLLWLSAPRLVARWSQPLETDRSQLTDEERADVQRYAERHWAYFDRFVTAESHWLAPDNFQADPAPVVAMRTSPTNIGLQLLATLSAHDLGLIAVPDVVERLERAFASMHRLQRYRGHFLNWYDLKDLTPLPPAYVSTVDSGNLAGHLLAVRQACRQLAAEHPALAQRLRRLAGQARTWVMEMEFGFLYDPSRKLFTIGFHTDTMANDDAFYDLLASEARLASFVAIAKNDVPVEHWFRLSRLLTHARGATTLVSWSGSMFEYLMPLLVMRSLTGTLLDQTYAGAVEQQRRYARTKGTPWGMSESLHNVRDHEQTYQYRAFGVPDLALQRGLGRDIVVAPYATALAALVDPHRALANLRAFETMGVLGPYGFFDALDYTRPAPGQPFDAVQAWMAHHVGMTLVALTNVLRSDIWVQRFHADPFVKATEQLLHERVPRVVVKRTAEPGLQDAPERTELAEPPVARVVDTREASAPRVALLGSGPYTVMLNHSGSGYSLHNTMAVTRWRADATTDDTGQFFYLKDLTTGRLWSAGAAPLGPSVETSSAYMALDRVALHRVDGEITTQTEITVVPGDAAEVRRITLTNAGRTPHDIELTSYSEIVMTSVDTDRAHPAFSNLFVETEWHAWCTAITAYRRPRSPSDPVRWCVHLVDDGPDRLGSVSCETDRARFIGRGRSVRNPQVFDASGPLSGTTGAVLDPIMALRTHVRIPPGQSVSVAFTTFVADSREAAFALADRYHAAHAAQRALDIAATVTQIELRELDLTASQAVLFQDLATQLLFGRGSLAPPADERWRNRSAQPTLWAYGISGDLPIVLATIDSMTGLSTLRELCMAHHYWRRRGLSVDLVIINGEQHGYQQELRDAINDAIASFGDSALVDQPGGTFVRRRDGLTGSDYLMLSATARLQVPCDGRSLQRILSVADLRASSAATPVEQERGGALATIVSAIKPLVEPLLPAMVYTPLATPVPPLDLPPLRFDNGIGGLDSDDSYLMRVDAQHLPPAPWINVIANPRGGCIVSESGIGCTWAENAHFFRLTPWHNDPVGNPISDVLYLQDEEPGDLWSATPAPVRSAGAYRVRHGAGFTTFEHEHNGIGTELTVGVPEADAVRLSVLRLTNRTDRPRQLVVTAFVEWVLGAHRDITQHQVRTRYVRDESCLMAGNSFDPAFMDWVAFLGVSEPVASYTADRQAFLGAHGSRRDPAALRQGDLNGKTGADLDPCGALQMRVTLAAGETRDIVVQVGAAASEAEARVLLGRYRTPAQARDALQNAQSAWSNRLGVMRVQTPEPSFDALINTWMLYQTTSSRLWARTGLYQSSGAYGFRDQLQDAMALLYAEPALARAQILRAAARQFIEGDVQHWWHPHTGRGVRTRFSDDLVWLPYLVDHYVRVTGDQEVLDVIIPFLTSEPLAPHEHERYELPAISEETASLAEHCRRALTRACTQGSHGLPLIGTGDWNDGLNLVGAEGRGESVWLAWFLITTLRAYADRATTRGDTAEASRFRQQADAYVEAVESHGWDGAWYRRAYYDDGTPMGTASDSECRIDSLAQTWSVISGAGQPDRQRQAMESVQALLVQRDARLIQLLSPPFDQGTRNPGYIKGYLPGVRENGAQYTHAALWVVMATALQGDGDQAFALFQLLNPLTHGGSPDGMAQYKVEPYVVAADVYTAEAQHGRGGWTWYTGSAGWMYRVGLEHLLGVTKEGNVLQVKPNVPDDWPGFSLVYRFGTALYEIEVRGPSVIRQHGARTMVDDVLLEDGRIPLVDDGRRHHVIIMEASITHR
jgi:cyclic beta-1,2-glucan synthetase